MEPKTPCTPSPCGPNSQCREVNDQAVCSCLPNYIGSPPGCRPECVVSSECFLDKACSNQKCVDPCPGTCGLNSLCRVVNHSPVCSCNPGHTGDPFTRCFPIPRKKTIFSSFNSLTFSFLQLNQPNRRYGQTLAFPLLADQIRSVRTLEVFLLVLAYLGTREALLIAVLSVLSIPNVPATWLVSGKNASILALVLAE